LLLLRFSESLLDLSPSNTSTLPLNILTRLIWLHQGEHHPGYVRDPTAPKRKGKTIQAPEPADGRPNLFDVYIPDAEDSHSNTVPPCGMQAAEPDPQPDSEQLLQMLFTPWKQMEDQQTEMIRLREVAAREKMQRSVSKHDY